MTELVHHTDGVPRRRLALSAADHEAVAFVLFDQRPVADVDRELDEGDVAATGHRFGEPLEPAVDRAAVEPLAVHQHRAAAGHVGDLLVGIEAGPHRRRRGDQLGDRGRLPRIEDAVAVRPPPAASTAVAHRRQDRARRDLHDRDRPLFPAQRLVRRLAPGPVDGQPQGSRTGHGAAHRPRSGGGKTRRLKGRRQQMGRQLDRHQAGRQILYQRQRTVVADRPQRPAPPVEEQLLHPRSIDRLRPLQAPLECRHRRFIDNRLRFLVLLVGARRRGLVPGAAQPELHLGRGQQCRRQMLGVVFVQRRDFAPAALPGRVAGGQAEQAWRPLGESLESFAGSRRFRQTEFEPRLSDLLLDAPRRVRSHHEDGQQRRLDPAARRPQRAPGLPAEDGRPHHAGQRRRDAAARRRPHGAFGGAALRVVGFTAQCSSSSQSLAAEMAARRPSAAALRIPTAPTGHRSR